MGAKTARSAEFVDRARFELAFRSMEELLSQLVVIERGAAGSRTVPSCIGTVIEHEATGARVLTAAHCMPEARRGSFDPLRVVFGGESSAVKSILSDSRFRGSVLPSAYDAAVLEFGTQLTAISRPHRVTEDTSSIVPGTLLKVAWIRKGGRTPELSEARVLASSSLTIVTELDVIGDCRGMSGAPAILKQGDSERVVGVISSGPTDCPGNVTLTRVAAVAGTLLLREPPALPSCGECADRLELDAAECKTSLRRCRGDSSCMELLECLRKPDAVTCTHATVKSGASVGLTRCVCARGCEVSCASLCEARTTGTR